MPRIAAFAIAATALSAAPAVAQTPAFVGYDAAQAPTLAERLVLCDVADQLSSGAPSRDAHRGYVRVEGSDRFELSLPPDFTRPSGWYDYDLERAYDRYRRAGQVGSDEVRQARERFRTPLRSRLHPLSVGDQRFFRAQAPFCRALVKASWRL